MPPTAKHVFLWRTGREIKFSGTITSDEHTVTNAPHTVHLEIRVEDDKDLDKLRELDKMRAGRVPEHIKLNDDLYMPVVTPCGLVQVVVPTCFITPTGDRLRDIPMGARVLVSTLYDRAIEYDDGAWGVRHGWVQSIKLL